MSSAQSSTAYRGPISPAARDKQHPPPSPSTSSASDDPSFSAAHFATSTPNRPRPRSGRSSTDEEEGEGEEEDLLRASDTESLPEVIEGRSGGIRAALTQRSLAELSSRRTGQRGGGNEMLMDGAALSFDATVGRNEGSRVRRVSREHMGRVGRAGSGSTGSSTLFEEGSAVRGMKGMEMVGSRRRKTLEVETVLEEDMDVSPMHGGKAAATRFSPSQLNAFIESKLSPSRNTPPSTSRSRRLPFQTPKAPGSYPTALSRSATPLTTPSASTQIHDAFNKFITGPDGAINNSAERRRLRERERQARETPTAVGRYPFTPRGEREMGRSWSVGARGGAPVEVMVDSPSSRPGRKEVGLGRTLSIMRDSQIESERNGLGRDEVDLAGYFAPSEDERDDGRESSSEQEEVQGGRGERSTIQFAMADSGSSMDDTEVLDEPPTPIAPVVTITSASLALSSSAGRALAASLSRRPRAESSPSRRIAPRSASPPLPPALPSPPTSPVPAPASLPRIRLSTSPRVLDPRSPRSPVTFDGPRHLLASPIPLPKRVGPISSTPPRPQKLSSSSSAPSTSPSRPPRSSSYRVSPPRVESMGQDPTVLQSLTKDLLSAVQSLSSLAPPVPQVTPVGIPELSRSLARIRSERRAGWDREREEFEAQASIALRDRDEIWRVLEKEREEEGRLALRFEDLRKGIEEMGNRVSVSVAAVVEESIRVESKKRSVSLTWLSILFLFTLWGLMRYSNARAQTLYQTTYYDPFHPALFLPSSSHFSLLPETLRTFSIESMQPDERIWETRVASILEWGTKEVGSLRDRLAVVRA